MQSYNDALKCVVVLQPMFFPWPGLLEQFRLCDTFVYYDDVQFSRGSFFNRVQIKTFSGVRWLTVPLSDWRLGQLINEVRIDNTKNWKSNQINQLYDAYFKAPFRDDMLGLVEEVFKERYDIISDLAQVSTEALIRYFPSIDKNTVVLKSSSLNIPGVRTQRLIDLCTALGARTYLTGHGARHYLEHERFEAQGINIAYIDYSLSEYPQLHGPFTPYVSSLDLIANCGKEGIKHIRGKMEAWKTFIGRFNKKNGDQKCS